MSFKLNSINIEIGKDNEKGFKSSIAKSLRITEDRIVSVKPLRISIDARKKQEVKYVCSFEVELKNEKEFLAKTKIKDIQKVEKHEYNPYPDVMFNLDKNLKTEITTKRPVIVGCGPAGLFCALNLAKRGLKPIVIERGEPVEDRIKSVEDFWNGGKLNTSSNVQFGEGGAGTFSDGKLNTMIKDSSGRIREVFETFVKYGADEKILYLNKPHIGTDRLVDIVRNIRNEIIALGGEVRFNTTLKDIIINDNTVEGIVIDKSNCNSSEKNITERIECDKLVLAIGHSARDTFEMLIKREVPMEQKPFAMGVRVQHSQEMISVSQYGEKFYRRLPAADYKLTANLENGRGVYSFCMCPGGFVVNASSEDGKLAVNGMSNSDRSEKSANSAVVVTVNTNDFEGSDVLAGMRLQQKLEQRAYNCCNGKVPVQTYGDFKNKISGTVPSNDNQPNIKGMWTLGSVRDFLPKFISDSIAEAFPKFGSMIHGYDRDDTLLMGLESRTSSPVRIIRGEDLQSTKIKGLYPCGEGAGYAGGITSAAVDGLKVFEAIIGNLSDKY